jgi:hypothetical protein
MKVDKPNYRATPIKAGVKTVATSTPPLGEVYQPAKLGVSSWADLS